MYKMKNSDTLYHVRKQRGYIITSSIIFLIFFVMVIPSVIYVCRSSSPDELCVVQFVMLMSTCVFNPVVYWIRNPLIRKCCLSLFSDTPELKNRPMKSSVPTPTSTNTDIFAIHTQTVNSDRVLPMNEVTNEKEK